MVSDQTQGQPLLPPAENLPPEGPPEEAASSVAWRPTGQCVGPGCSAQAGRGSGPGCVAGQGQLELSCSTQGDGVRGVSRGVPYPSSNVLSAPLNFWFSTVPASYRSMCRTGQLLS